MAKEQSGDMKKIQQLNEKYKADKSAYETLLADKSKEQALGRLQSELNMMEARNDFDEKSGQPHTYDDNAIKAKKDEIEAAKKALEEYKEKLQGALDKVNSRVTALKEMPGMKDYINDVVARRYEKEAIKAQRDIDTYKKLQTIIEEHPNVKSQINALVKNNRKVSSLQSAITKLEAKTNRTPEEETELTNKKQELATLQGKIETEIVAPLTTFIDKNYPDLTPEQRNVIFELTTTNLEKAIAGKEKHLQHMKEEYEGVLGHPLQMKGEQQEEKEEKAGKARKGKKEESNLPANPPKLGLWARIKKFFKDAFRGEKEETKDSTTKTEESAREEESTPKDEKPSRAAQFRSAYQYDIVKDTIDHTDEDVQKAAKNVRKMTRSEESKGDSEESRSNDDGSRE